MAKRRLIPKLQLMQSSLIPDDLALVTTVGFTRVIEVGDPVSQAKIYQAQAVDELTLIDIDPYRNPQGYSGKESFVRLLHRISKEIFLPLTVGGGVTSLDDFRQFLFNGADKISINTTAVNHPELITAASTTFGAQCVVVSIDYRKRADGSLSVFTHGATLDRNIHPLDWAIEVERRGAGEILLTNIDRDGTRVGLDLDCIRQISSAVQIPIIAAGGCGRASHFVDGFIEGKADAVAAGTFFSFQDQNPMQARSHIKNAGIPIRIYT